MFAKTIIDSDAFLDMPLSTQALYFHLSMRADDDGFLNNAKKITRTVGANQNDYDLLLVKGFIIPFDDGICVIKHWRIHNYIQKDRYKPTVYQEEKSRLVLKGNNTYTLATNTADTQCIHGGYSLEAQVRLGKDRLGKDRLAEGSKEELPTSAKRITTMIESVFGRLASPYEVELLLSYLENGIQIELVEKALAETIENGVRNIKYSKSILDRCVKEKILTLEKYMIDKDAKRKAGDTGGGSNARTDRNASEPVEDQFAEYAKRNGIWTTCGAELQY